MILDLTAKQRLMTYLGMSVCSLFFYGNFLVKQSPLLQTLYLGIISVIFSGDRPTLIFATIASLPRDMK